MKTFIFLIAFIAFTPYYDPHKKVFQHVCEHLQYQMTTKKISLLTYNVFLRPPPIKTNQDDYKEERFSEILNVIRGYDVVCLQQMFQMGTFRLEKLLEFAIQNKFYYWKASDPPLFGPGPVVDSGLIVLSKYPIISSQFASYRLGILSDSASDKGYIYCRIKIQNSILHLFATHLQASYMEPGKELERELSVKVRLKQVQILTQRIGKLLKQNEYTSKDLVMLVGDLNINARQTPFRLTHNSYLSSYTQRNHLSQRLNQNNFSEYQTFLNLFELNHMVLIDHIFQRYREHKVTYGDNEKILTGESQSQSYQRLDYIFTLVPTSLSQKIEQSNLRAKTSTCMVQQLKRPSTKYGQLSDHYGVSIQIEETI